MSLEKIILLAKKIRKKWEEPRRYLRLYGISFDYSPSLSHKPYHVRIYREHMYMCICMSAVVHACVRLCATIWGRARRLGWPDRRDIGGAGATIHHIAETSRHIAGSDVTLEISTNNLYADVSARSRFVGLPIRNNKLTPPRAIVLCARHIYARWCEIWKIEVVKRLWIWYNVFPINFWQFKKIIKKNKTIKFSFYKYSSIESILNQSVQFILSIRLSIIKPLNFQASYILFL